MSSLSSVLIVSPHKLLRDCLVASLASEEVFGRPLAVATAEEAVTHCLSASPDLLVVDAALPGRVAGELLANIRRLGLPIRTAVLGLPDDAEAILAAIEVGADAYVSREAGLVELKRTLAGLAAGESFCPPRVALRLFQRLAELAAQAGGTPPPKPQAPPPLTPREAEILKLVAEGLPNKEIARRLYLSLATVKNHVHSILDKLGVPGRWAAAAYLRNDRSLALGALPRGGVAV